MSRLRYKPTGANDCARLQELMAKKSRRGRMGHHRWHQHRLSLCSGKDNQEYLQQKTCWGSPRFSGAVFLDTRNRSRDEADSYNLLYAHHMDNGAMFGDVDRFLDRASLTCTARARSTQRMGRSACALLPCARLLRVMTLSLGRETWTRPRCRRCHACLADGGAREHG